MQTNFKATAGLFAYLFARLMTSGYPSGANIRQNRHRWGYDDISSAYSFNSVLPVLLELIITFYAQKLKVLGAVKYKRACSSSDDVNNMREQGSYTFVGASQIPTNLPEDGIGSGIIIIFLCSNWNIQLIFTPTKTFKRMGTSSSWYEWQTL